MDGLLEVPAFMFNLGTDAFFANELTLDAGKACFVTLLYLEAAVVDGLVFKIAL